MIRTANCSLLLLCLVRGLLAYEIPEPIVQVYVRGFEISIPHENGIEYFAFSAHRNSEISRIWSGGTTRYEGNGRWAYRTIDVELKLDDTLKGLISVIKNGRMYIKEVRYRVVKANEGTTINEPATYGDKKTPKYVMPTPNFIIYRKGFQVSIPHENGMEYFTFSAYRNSELELLHRETWSGVITQCDANGHWTYRNHYARLQPNDRLNYRIAVKKNGNYTEYSWTYTVNEYAEP